MKYHATSDAVSEMLSGGGEFLKPETLLSDLTEEQATVLSPASPYSIAQIVAHMHYWQERQLAFQCGEKPPRPDSLEETFAAPPPGTWHTLVQEFLAGIAACRTRAAEGGENVSPTERDDTSVAYDFAENALHNAYHLGQIALLRQMQGFGLPDDENSSSS
jgi:hypothetical protein